MWIIKSIIKNIKTKMQISKIKTKILWKLFLL